MFKENTIVGYLDSGDTGYLAFRLAGYTAGQISGKRMNREKKPLQASALLNAPINPVPSQYLNNRTVC